MQQEKILGSGGFSSVYRLGEGKVLKRPNPNVSQNIKAHILKNYKRQKAILDKLHEIHPTKTSMFNKIYEINQANQLIMKDLGDTDLHNVINDDFEKLAEDVDNVIPQLMDAVITVLRSGVVHKDIKPNNIMATYNPETNHYTLTLIDFADSLTKKEIEEKFNKFILGGTQRFMSPELLKRKYVKGIHMKGTWKEYVSNDLWSLGMVLYMILYGKHPHTMFMDMNPSEKNKNRKPNMFYDNMMEHPELYNQLFPIGTLPEQKKKYVHIVKSLLSLNPDNRIRWLNSYINQKAKRRGVQMLVKASQNIQAQQQKRKRRLGMLVQASQQKKHKPSTQMLALQQQKSR